MTVVVATGVGPRFHARIPRQRVFNVLTPDTVDRKNLRGHHVRQNQPSIKNTSPNTCVPLRTRGFGRIAFSVCETQAAVSTIEFLFELHVRRRVITAAIFVGPTGAGKFSRCGGFPQSVLARRVRGLAPTESVASRYSGMIEPTFAPPPFPIALDSRLRLVPTASGHRDTLLRLFKIGSF